jgi:hypothetical protein
MNRTGRACCVWPVLGVAWRLLFRKGSFLLLFSFALPFEISTWALHTHNMAGHQVVRETNCMLFRKLSISKVARKRTICVSGE